MAKLKASLSKEYLSKPYESHEEPLSRLELANQLTSLYANLEHGTVAVLNGRWGSGKSTFSKKLVHHLDASGISTTYFDAFAKDFSDSPFLALSAHVVDEIKKRGNQTLPSAREIKEKSKKVSKKLASTSAKVLVKAVTLGLIGASEIDALSEVASDIGDATGGVAEEVSLNVFDEYLEAESDFEQFRSSLNGLAEALGSSDTVIREGDSGLQSKTVFIIDELDRCRPDFALGILEVIKHLFDNENVHFLLVTNIDYLVASVNSRYGMGNSSSEYLEKFYDFVIFFEEKPWDRSRHAAAALVDQRLTKLLEGRNDRAVYDLIESLQLFARGFDLSLRQASALATNAALAFLADNDRTFRP
uniref:KAP family P-loop NTPase fold protein n=1 Tax=Altererythrobacter sp. TaxID=1872480 RepID=UPI003CFDE25F